MGKPATKPSRSQAQYDEATVITANNLREVAVGIDRELTQLALPEIDEVVEEVSRVVPAGNVPALILEGLSRLSGRRAGRDVIKRDVNLLFNAVNQVLDRAVYGALFAGPAAVIWGYQHLLRLAGKDPEQSFPEGTWQFYVDYALREDTARHASETHGFDTTLRRERARLQTVDRITAWAMAAITTLHEFNGLLENEWRERVHTDLLRQVTQDRPDAVRYRGLFREWQRSRLPYHLGDDAEAGESYVAYRRRRFDRWLDAALRHTDDAVRAAWQAHVAQAEADALPAYQRQMNIVAYLEPGPYGETRQALPLDRAHIALVYRGHYYLIPAAERDAEGGLRPPSLDTVRGQVAFVLSYPRSGPPVDLCTLVQVRRAELPKLLESLDGKLKKELNKLRLSPIVLNMDQRDARTPLSAIRQGERGLGGHPLTIFDTGESFVFDQSHIFFDGAWGVALAEIMTNMALDWAAQLHNAPRPDFARSRPHAPKLAISMRDQTRIATAPRVVPEVSAENTGVDLKALTDLRATIKRRSDLLTLTINDLLLLYRAIHAVRYEPGDSLLRAFDRAEKTDRSGAVQAARDWLAPAAEPPAVLIPVDSSLRQPRDRVHPLSFAVPLDDLDLLALHDTTLAALKTYERSRRGQRAGAYRDFITAQRAYLLQLAAFGGVMAQAKIVAGEGRTTSINTIKLLAHMPTALQRLLDRIPGRFEAVYDIIKGREVFSNVGVVAHDSSLRRFITAKDDNDKKTLAWGVLTDADGVMHITLRDFRPHIPALLAAGQHDLARMMTADYLDAYVRGINAYVRDLLHITTANKERYLLDEDTDPMV